MDYLKLISEKWNLTAKFNCLQAIYVDAPIALAVPMCGPTPGRHAHMALNGLTRTVTKSLWPKWHRQRGSE